MTAIETSDQKRTSDWPEKTQNVRKARTRCVEKTARLKLQERKGYRNVRRKEEKKRPTQQEGTERRNKHLTSNDRR
jgi:hypothetical protein